MGPRILVVAAARGAVSARVNAGAATEFARSSADMTVRWSRVGASGEAVEARGERTRKKEKGEGRSAKNHINCNNSRFCKCPTHIPSAAVS